jgi:hypothetical protein
LGKILRQIEYFFICATVMYMTTRKQRLAIQKTVENGGNVTKAMREAGYSESTVNNPSNLTESQGYKDLLRASGLDESLVVSSLVSDIKKKPKNRIRELSLAADLLGMKDKKLQEKEDKQIVVQIVNYGDL